MGGLRLVAAGSVIGLVLAFAGGQLASRFLFGIDGTDPVTFLGVPLLLGSVAFVAGCSPAYRVSRVDPVRELHSD